MKTIGFYVSPGFQMLDLAGPAGAFEAANRELGRPAYRITVLAAEAGAVTNSLGMTIAAASVDEAVPDTLMVVGGRLDLPLPADMLGRLAETASRTRRVASVCVGAFTLAAAGLLDGRRATTHWRYAARLQREYPSVRVEADRIFCRDGNVWLRPASLPASISRWPWSRRTTDLRSPRAWPSTSSSTIVATAGNRSSQLPLIWRQRMTESPRLSAMPATTSPKRSPLSAWRNRPA